MEPFVGKTSALKGRRLGHVIGTDGPGGAERVFAALARGVATFGAESIVFLPRDGEGWLDAQLCESEVKIQYFDMQGGVPLGQQLLEHFEAQRLDLVHSHMSTAALHTAWAARSLSLPHAVTMHGSDHRHSGLRKRLALRAALAVSDRVVAVSSAYRDRLCRDLLIRRYSVEVVPNGVDFCPEDRSLLRQELSLDPGAALVVSVGNLYPVKGHRYLLTAVARLTEHPSLHLAIAGRGRLEGDLRQQAKALGIEDRVHLLGLRSDIPNILAAADLFVLPSVSEAFPLSILEAMSAGCPIIASDVGGVREALANPECGTLVRSEDPAQLAQAMDAVLTDPRRARRLGEAAAARAAADYRVERMLERYASLYAGMLDGAAPRDFR